VYNGVDVAIDVRLPKGFSVNGGLNSGRTEYNNCGLAEQSAGCLHVRWRRQTTLTGAPGGTTAARTNAYCDVVPPWSADTQVKVSGTIPLPYQFYTGVTYQSLPGIPYYASAVFRNADIAPSLGRNLSAGANGTVTVDLIPPMSQFEDRIQQIDLRFARTFLYSGKRFEPEFDIYNALKCEPDPVGETATTVRRMAHPDSDSGRPVVEVWCESDLLDRVAHR